MVQTLCRQLLFILALSFFASAAAQQTLTLREWQKDVAYIQRDIMTPLREDFNSYDFPPGWRVYLNSFLDKMRSERANLLHQGSYQMVRDVMLMLSQDFEILIDDGSWQHAERYLTTKLDLVTNLLALTADDF